MYDAGVKCFIYFYFDYYYSKNEKGCTGSIFVSFALYLSKFYVVRILEWSKRIRNTSQKVSESWVFSGPYFPAFGLNTEVYQVNLCIQSKRRKIWTKKSLDSDTFCVVKKLKINQYVFKSRWHFHLNHLRECKIIV